MGYLERVQSLKRVHEKHGFKVYLEGDSCDFYMWCLDNDTEDSITSTVYHFRKDCIENVVYVNNRGTVSGCFCTDWEVFFNL